MVGWIAPDARPVHVLRVYAAAAAAGCDIEFTAPPGAAVEVPGVVAGTSSPERFADRLGAAAPDALRIVGTRPAEFAALDAVCFVDDREPLADGLIEGLRYRREQAVSRTLHRFGNVIVPTLEVARQTP